MIFIYGLSNTGNNCNDSECPWTSFSYCKPFQVRYFCTCAFISRFIYVATCTFEMCKYLITYLLTYLLTYFLQGSRSIHSLHARFFEPLHRVWDRASTGSKAFGLGDKAPQSQRIFIKQIWNSNISKHNCNSLWSFSPTSELRIFRDGTSIVAKCCQQSIDDRRLWITLSVQLCAKHDDDWMWRNASRGSLVSVN